MKTLRKGDKGNDVTTLQKALGITADGDFGPKTEEAVKKYQSEHGLTADGIVGNKTWASLDIVESTPKIVQKPLSVHLGISNGRKIKYLVIHFTAGGSSAKGSAAACYNVFTNRDASADFAVDDVEMVQFNGDIANKYTWAVGDGKGKYGVTNANSISIEMCSNLKKGYSAKYPSHNGWYFTDATIDNTVTLAKYLMNKYNIPLDRVIRHYDASRKQCMGVVGWLPVSILDDKTGKAIGKGNEDKWIAFKERLK